MGSVDGTSSFEATLSAPSVVTGNVIAVSVSGLEIRSYGDNLIDGTIQGFLTPTPLR